MSKRKLPERANSRNMKMQRMDSTSYDGLSELEKLPLEILEKIIGNLHGDDILQLSAASKNLNSLIAGSSKLLQGIKFRMITKYELDAHEDDDDYYFFFSSNEWNNKLGTRKYTSIIFRGICYKYNDDLTKILAPLKNFKSSVKSIEFDFHTFYGITRTLIKKVLSMCTNVEELKVNSVRRQYVVMNDWFHMNSRNFFSSYAFSDYESEPSESDYRMVESDYRMGPKPLKKLQSLKILHFCGVYSMLDFFKNCTLQKLIIDETMGEEYTTLHKLRLQRFLQTQPDLKSLHFLNLGDRIFRDNEMSDDMPFKLKELIIGKFFDYFTKIERCLPYFRSFLESHKDTLETFQMNDYQRPSVPILEILSSFPKLKKLDIKINETSSEFPLMKHIEHLLLKADEKIPIEFNDKFPNVKKLELDNFVVDNFTDEHLQEMKNLDSIVFKCCRFNESLSISVKKVIIDNSRWLDGRIDLKGVSELTITNCRKLALNWLATFLQENAGKLKYLNFINSVIPDEVHTFLKSDHKIHVVIR